MDKQLQEIYDNAEKAGVGWKGLEWLKQFETFEEVENDKDAHEYFVWYAENVIKGKWELGEEAISKDGWDSLNYACVIKTRFELGEKTISKGGWYSYNYSYAVIRGRWELGEEAISKSGWTSYLYARDILKTRFELGENAILNSRWKEPYEKLFPGCNFHI